ncbi:M48 family metalloprotease [Pontibacter mangrovi]|uniref:Peptidase M48 domain-containing protein n=1 Tax=Pontibacter mangrovi TaxID=2589816 RepID=A0A501W7D2_9BACT|nr:M48 family metalloprotease [Pontibacter mangrovi]TPE44240.1 hypothetical protein FJM65_08750 [Pontibacter mangrovi]
MFLLYSSAKLRAVVVCMLLLLSGLSVASASQNEYFPFYEPDTTKLHRLATAKRESLVRYLQVPEGVSADYKKSFASIVARTATDSYERVRYTALLDTVISPFVQEVFQEVLAANKELPPANLVLTRSPVENAYALADGTIFFNVGLLSKLQNEGQLAYIICHELAHIKLRHMERNITEILDVMHGRYYKKQYKKLTREKYNKYAKMESFLEGLTLNSLYHKRSLETQADSLGLILYTNTRYSIADAFGTLQLLDKVDLPYSVQPVDINRYFGCAGYTYKPQQNGTTASVFNISAQQPDFAENPDTLKTHPDCMKRLAYIRQLAGDKARAAKPESGYSQGMRHIADLAKREVTQSWYDSGNYDYSLFNALLLLQGQPGSTYLRSMVQMSLAGLKRHMEQHRFGEMVAVASDYKPANLNDFLNFLNSLNTSDFKSIGNCLNSALAGAEAVPANKEYGLMAKYAQAILLDKEQEADRLRNIYLEEYKEGRFGPLLLWEGIN